MKKLLFFLLSIFLYSAEVNYYIFNHDFYYKELYNNLVLDKETTKFGDLVGIGAEFNFVVDNFNNNFILEYSRGKTTYDGATWGGTPLNLTKNNVFIFNGKYLISYKNFPLYIGLGYRYWHRGKSDYVGDYNEDYKWFYYIVSLQKRIYISDAFYTLPKISYNKAINPKMYAEIGKGYTFELGNTNGYLIKLPLFYKINNTTSINISYEYSYWHISESNPVYITELSTYAFEPESKTYSKKLEIGINFKY